MGQFFPSGYEYGFVCPLGTLPTAIPRPACTGRSPQNSNNPITHSLSLPLSIAMQAALFWGSVGKKRERTARSTPGSQKKKRHPRSGECDGIAQPWNGRSPEPLDTYHPSMRLIKDLDGGPGRPSIAGNACRMRHSHTTTRDGTCQMLPAPRPKIRWVPC
jgi:hypothetical protein